MLLFLLETLIHRFLLLKTHVLDHFSVMTCHNSHCFLSLRIASRGQEAETKPTVDSGLCVHRHGWLLCLLGLRIMNPVMSLFSLLNEVETVLYHQCQVVRLHWDSWWKIKVAKNLGWIRWRSTAIFYNNVKETNYWSPLTLLVGMQTSPAIMENSVEIT